MALFETARDTGGALLPRWARAQEQTAATCVTKASRADKDARTAAFM